MFEIWKYLQWALQVVRKPARTFSCLLGFQALLLVLAVDTAFRLRFCSLSPSQVKTNYQQAQPLGRGKRLFSLPTKIHTYPLRILRITAKKKYVLRKHTRPLVKMHIPVENAENIVGQDDIFFCRI